MEIIINDRRGANKEKVERPEAKLKLDEDTVDVDVAGERTWIEVKYLALPTQVGNGLMIMVRACGHRSDGLPFRVDYLLYPEIEPGEDWTVEPKKRLDTFLNCSCGPNGPCSTHKVYMAQWARGDMERIELRSRKPMPNIIEMIMRADMAAQQNQIIKPGR